MPRFFRRGQRHARLRLAVGVVTPVRVHAKRAEQVILAVALDDGGGAGHLVRDGIVAARPVNIVPAGEERSERGFEQDVYSVRGGHALTMEDNAFSLYV